MMIIREIQAEQTDPLRFSVLRNHDVTADVTHGDPFDTLGISIHYDVMWKRLN